MIACPAQPKVAPVSIAPARPAVASSETVSQVLTEGAGLVQSLNQIEAMTGRINARLHAAMEEIKALNLQTRLLSFNAQLEAGRAGAAGHSFAVVAKEMGRLADGTAEVSRRLDESAQADIAQLAQGIQEIGERVRGTRLSDLAATNVDLLERNLYERTCDVRWWATDSSCVDACLDPAKAEHASHRLGVILDSYTVYYDIVLCDLAGRIIANGRPEKYACIGHNQADTLWFRKAQATVSGEEYGFEGLHCSPVLADGQPIIVYSTMVRRGGVADGEPIGCLGIVFNWEALAQTIMHETQIGRREQANTRVFVTDAEGRIIADSRNRHLRERFGLARVAERLQAGKGHTVQTIAGEPCLVAYAPSRGYETYRTGWHSFIVQRLAAG